MDNFLLIEEIKMEKLLPKGRIKMRISMGEMLPMEEKNGKVLPIEGIKMGKEMPIEEINKGKIFPMEVINMEKILPTEDI